LRYSYQTSRQTPIWILISINLIFFIASLVNYGLIINYFALNSLILAQHPWTIITSIFVHANWWHILSNMLTLFFFGTYLLQLVGQRKFWLVYFIGGLAGNALFLLLAPGQTVVGASGAIFALGGALAVMRPNIRVFVFPIPAPIPLWIAVIGGFILVSFLGGVAWQAHLGGILAGLIAGFIFRRQERRRPYRF
jgi:membrane associated rhomboid family serine protease